MSICLIRSMNDRSSLLSLHNAARRLDRWAKMPLPVLQNADRHGLCHLKLTPAASACAEQTAEVHEINIKQ